MLPDEVYSKNVSCALNYIYTFLQHKPLFKCNEFTSWSFKFYKCIHLPKYIQTILVGFTTTYAIRIPFMLRCT